MGIVSRQYIRGFNRVPPRYYVVEVDPTGQSGWPEPQEISSQEFEDMVRGHNPGLVDSVMEMSRQTNGQYFLSQTKTLLYRSVEPK